MTFRTLLLTVCLFLASLARADVWVSDSKAVHKLSPDLSSVTLSVPSARALYLAVDPRDKSLWILSSAKLTKLSSAGSMVFERDLAALGMQAAVTMALDGRDGSLWLGEGGGSATAQNKGVVHLSDQGVLIRSIPSPGQIRSMAVGLNQTVWILGGKSVHQHSRDGEFRRQIDLSPLVDGEPKLLQVDSIGTWLWVAGERRLLRADFGTPPHPPVLLATPSSVRSLASDEAAGLVHALVAEGVLIVSEAGTVHRTIAVQAASSRATAFDPVTASLLVSQSSGLYRLPRGADTAQLVTLGLAIEQIGVEPLVVATSATIVRPFNGGLIAVARPTFVIEASSVCSGNPCAFEPAIYDGYTVSATLDGMPPLPFAFDPGSNTFRHTPAAALADGTHILKVSVASPFGAPSSEVVSAFVVDTTPPSFVSLSPTSPAVTNATTASITGRLSETATLSIGGQPVPVGADGGFSTVRPLNEGENAITLSAIDPAGNVSTLTLLITRDTIAPSFSNVAPPNGFSSPSASIRVTGNLSESSTITVTLNGVSTTQQGTAFDIPVTLSSGTNMIEIVARDRAGNQATLVVSATLNRSGIPGDSIS